MKFLGKLKKTATKSQLQHRHATLIVKGGSIISSGCNSEHTHSEKAALRNLWPGAAVNSIAINIRLRRNGVAAMARPCSACRKLLQKAGIRKVRYTTGFTVEWHEETLTKEKSIG